MFIRRSLTAAAAALALLPAAAGGGETGRPVSPDATAPGLPESPEAAPVLRNSVLIKDRYVYLGDIFANAGQFARKAVAHAPAPGKRTSLDARWLYRIAQVYGLKWRPVSLSQAIVIERAAVTISAAEIEDAVHSALIERGAKPGMELEIATGRSPMHIPVDADGAVPQVKQISYDSRSGRFTAVVAAPADDPAAQRLRVTGRAHAMEETPVAVRPLRRGETISARDIAMKPVRKSRLQHDTIMVIDDLVGMSPRRNLSPGDAIRETEIEKPLLVRRGKLVTLELSFVAMRLTAQGKALENGAEGDYVRVRNTQSNQVVEGEVDRTGRVVVTMTSPFKQASR